MREPFGVTADGSFNSHVQAHGAPRNLWTVGGEVSDPPPMEKGTWCTAESGAGGRAGPRWVSQAVPRTWRRWKWNLPSLPP